MASRPTYCPHCGEEVQHATGRYCTKCGGDLVQVDETSAVPVPNEPRVPARSSTPKPAASPPQSSSGNVLCHGCGQVWGPPGAICTGCGSRIRDPNAWRPAAALGALAVVAFLIAVALQGGESATKHPDPVGSVFTVIGVLAGLGALALGAQWLGRVGPEQQQSCCGCSCVVLLLVLPAAGVALWSAGGPVLAAAVFPSWVILDRTWQLGARIYLALRRRVAGDCFWPKADVGLSGRYPGPP